MLGGGQMMEAFGGEEKLTIKQETQNDIEVKLKGKGCSKILFMICLIKQNSCKMK